MLGWISTAKPVQKHSEFRDQRQAGTCEWFLTEPKYLDW